MNIDLLLAKDAIFKLIFQFHHATKFDDGDLYIYDLCESALERSFSVLGIEEDYIKLIDFCKLREKNDRAIWSFYSPQEPYGGLTAESYAEILTEDYERFTNWR